MTIGHINGESGNRSVARRRHREGYTLVELMASMAVSAILLTAMASTLFIGLRAVPSSQRDPEASIIAGQILDQLIEELGTALYVTQLTTTSISFTVPPRGSDLTPERISYSWSGKPGAPLTRQYNGGTVVTLIPAVNQFALTPSVQNVQETYPGICTESAVSTLLADCTTGSGNPNYQVTPSTSYGQYFKPVTGGGVYAWRPTYVQFMAEQGSLLGVTSVQVQPANATLTPNGTINEQTTLNGASLSGSYSWQQVNLTQETPLAVGSGICVLLIYQSGLLNSAILQGNNQIPGLLQLGGSGQWQYQQSAALYAQLYGTLTTSSTSQYVNSSYLTTLGVQLQIAATAAPLQTTAAMLNHPELLKMKWEANFTQNPTTIDVNADGLPDWIVDGGGAFNPSSLSGGAWTTSGTLLDTSPAANYATTTVVDLEMQNTTIGGKGATFNINALGNASTCAPLSVYLALQADGTQTLTVVEQLTAGNSKTLITVPGLPGSTVVVHLIIDPVSSGVCVKANSVYYGTFPITQVSNTIGSALASIGSNGSTSIFRYARIRVLNQ